VASVSFQRRRDQASLLWLFGLFALLPFTVVFGHKGLAPWLLLASFPVFVRGDFWLQSFGALFDRMDPTKPFFAAFLSILFFCFWIFVSGFWSPRNMPSLAMWVLAPVLVGGCVVWYSANVNRVWAWRIAFAYAAAIVTGMGVLAIEGASGGAIRSVIPPEEGRARDVIALGRGVTGLAPALFPAGIIAAAVWNRWVALGVLALGVAAAYLNDVSANAIALAAGLAAAVIAFKAPKSTVTALVFAALAALFLSPFAALLPVERILAAGDGVIPPSWLHRVAIWQASGAAIPDCLPFGCGADYARTWKETAPRIDVPGAPFPLSVIPNHPHNLHLQIWLELGLPGVLGFAGFLYWGGRAFARADLQVSIIAAASGAFAAVLMSTLVETSLWQVWRFAAMGLAAMGVGLAHSMEVRSRMMPEIAPERPKSRFAVREGGAGDVTAVVISYFTGPLLARSVEALRRQPEIKQIVVIDNGNLPGEVQNATASDGGPAVTLSTYHGNIGFAAACNEGAAIARGEFLLFINPDAIMPEDGVARLLQDTKKLERPWLMGAKLVGPDGVEQQGSRRSALTPWRAFVEATKIYRIAPRHRSFRRFNLHGEPCPEKLVETPVISGACFFLHADDYAEIGGMDERYFLHVEDVDFCLRFTKAGGRVYFNPHVSVEHFKSSSRANPSRVDRRKTQSMIRYFNTHFSDTYPKPSLWILSGLFWGAYAALSLRRAAVGALRALGFRARAGARASRRAKSITSRRSSR
jgi:GT2 family glycosyltransferase/O-antigen ligase